MSYYTEKLAAERLKKCYELGSPRIVQYLKAEIDYVRSLLDPFDCVIETGCGYGRVLRSIAKNSAQVCGFDNSLESLAMASRELADCENVFLAAMSAGKCAFKSGSFDKVICIQNGISAFHHDKTELIRECLRITKPGGMAIFSTYSEKFWPERLAWFGKQSEHGLIGQIDYARTGNGQIVCEDGFTASTVSPDDFNDLLNELKLTGKLVEIDDSSLFCLIRKPI